MREILLDSWLRQARIIESLAELVDDDIRLVRPSTDGWSMDHHLAHIH